MLRFISYDPTSLLKYFIPIVTSAYVLCLRTMELDWKVIMSGRMFLLPRMTMCRSLGLFFSQIDYKLISDNEKVLITFFRFVRQTFHYSSAPWRIIP